MYVWLKPFSPFCSVITLFKFFIFLKILSIFYDYYSYYNYIIFLYPLYSSALYLPSHQHSPLWFMSMGRTYKVSVFSISYTILNLPCLFLPTNYASYPCMFSPILLLPCPTDNPPSDLHFYDSIPVLVVCLVCFCFVLFLASVFASFEFVVILLFIVSIIFFFLDKSL